MDSALYNKAVQNGTSFKSRNEAVNDFSTKYATKYPNKFTSEPSTRPSYIPQSTMYNGQSYNIIYNPAYGGYGYWYGGQWMMYDLMRDTMMMSMLMNNHGYYYPGIVPMGGGGMVYGGPSIAYTVINIIGGILALIFLSFFLYVLFRFLFPKRHYRF